MAMTTVSIEPAQQTAREFAEMVERATQSRLNMTVAEFRSAYLRGDLAESDDPDVPFVAGLVFAGDDGQADAA